MCWANRVFLLYFYMWRLIVAVCLLLASGIQRHFSSGTEWESINQLITDKCQWRRAQYKKHRFFKETFGKFPFRITLFFFPLSTPFLSFPCLHSISPIFQSCFPGFVGMSWSQDDDCTATIWVFNRVVCRFHVQRTRPFGDSVNVNKLRKFESNLITHTAQPLRVEQDPVSYISYHSSHREITCISD